MSSTTADNKNRCPRCLSEQIYRDYHDNERGVPVHDDRTHFEFLILEGAQAGLSWLTILKRREGYRQAFANRNPQVVASYDEEKIQALLLDPGIIRNKLKVRSAVKNAQVFLQIQQEFGSFDGYIRGFTDGQVIDNQLHTPADYVATSGLSDRVSKDLKQRGMSFVGSTIIYAHLQATGIINDHLVSCWKH